MLRHLDLLDDIDFGQILERPGQMLGVDALHRRAHANGRRHELHDFALGPHFLREPVDQIQFGSNQPARIRRRFRDRLDNVLG